MGPAADTADVAGCGRRPYDKVKGLIMKSKVKAKAKLVALVNMLLAGCTAWSCTGDMRNAMWAGTMDYVTDATTETLSAMISVGDLFGVEE